MTLRPTPKILILAAEPERFAEPLRTLRPNLETTLCDDYGSLAEALERTRPTAVLASRIGDAAFPRELLTAAESVAWIQAASAGVDHFLPCSDRVMLTCARGVHDDVLSDYVLCAVLAHNLHWSAFQRDQIRQRWSPRELEPARGQRLVVLGYGSIGRAVASKARALGMTTLGVRRQAEGEPSVVGLEALPAVLAEADALAVTLPRTPETVGLVDRRLLSAMKPGSLLVNVSRGGVVDEGALVEALDRGPLAGAVLDVFETEPLPEGHPFWTRDDVRVTPHTGDAAGWQARVAALFSENLDRFLQGEPLRHRVDPKRGY